MTALLPLRSSTKGDLNHRAPASVDHVTRYSNDFRHLLQPDGNDFPTNTFLLLLILPNPPHVNETRDGPFIRSAGHATTANPASRASVSAIVGPVHDLQSAYCYRKIWPSGVPQRTSDRAEQITIGRSVPSKCRPERLGPLRNKEEPRTSRHTMEKKFIRSLYYRQIYLNMGKFQSIQFLVITRDSFTTPTKPVAF